MRHNCHKCGYRFEGSVCPECGEIYLTEKQRRNIALSKLEKGNAYALSKRDENKNTALMWVLLIAVAVFVISILSSNGVFGGKAYLETVENYFNSICESDFDKFVGTMPDCFSDIHESDREALGYEKDEYLKLLYESYFLEYGEDMTVSLEYGETESTPQAIIDTFVDGCQELYGVDFFGAKFLTLRVNATFSGSVSSQKLSYDCFLMKFDGSWYIVGCDYVTE